MRFEIRALDRSSGGVTLEVNAETSEGAAIQAREQGLTVLRVRQISGGLWPLFGKGSDNAFPLAQFSQELYTLLEAGLSVVEALETITEKQPRPERRHLLRQLVGALYRGESFSRALENFPQVFPPLYVATVQASERTGNLVESLGRYVVYQNQLDLVRKKVVSASIYPMMLIVVGGLVITFLLGYVVPRFSRIFSDLGRDLPAMSRWLMDWGVLVANNSTAFVAGTLATAMSILFWVTRPNTKRAVMAQLMRIPAIGDRVRIYQLARFYRSLGMLLRGGIPIMPSLKMTSGLLQGYLHAQLDQAMRKIREGVPISQAMDAAGLTTAVSSRMLRVGERTGQMGEMMERIAHFYDDEIARWIDWFIRLFEPVLMLVIGVAIGAIVVLMYFPIFELAGSLN